MYKEDVCSKKEVVVLHRYIFSDNNRERKIRVPATFRKKSRHKNTFTCVQDIDNRW